MPITVHAALPNSSKCRGGSRGAADFTGLELARVGAEAVRLERLTRGLPTDVSTAVTSIAAAQETALIRDLLEASLEFVPPQAQARGSRRSSGSARPRSRVRAQASAQSPRDPCPDAASLLLRRQTFSLLTLERANVRRGEPGEARNYAL
jgi:hypothetical protein